MLARATSMIVDDDGDGDARSAIARDGNGFAVEFVEREERGISLLFRSGHSGALRKER